MYWLERTNNEATGESFTAFTYTNTSCVTDANPSETVMVKESVPCALAFGVYVKLPSSVIEAAPIDGAVVIL